MIKFLLAIYFALGLATLLVSVNDIFTSPYIMFIVNSAHVALYAILGVMSVKRLREAIRDDSDFKRDYY